MKKLMSAEKEEKVQDNGKTLAQQKS